MAHHQGMLLLHTLLCCALIANASSDNVLPRTQSVRTELKVSRSLDPDKMQTLEVMSRDGTLTQLIVKKRDSKAKAPPTSGQQKETTYTNWIPIGSSNTYHKWSSKDKENTSFITDFANANQGKKISNIIDSDIIPYVPRPVMISSEDIYFKAPSNTSKKSRSVSIDVDGIPVVHGVRMPDDEQDKFKTWRNARVINGELFPYENGYRPPLAIPIGQLVYATGQSRTATSTSSGLGPFTKEDNFRPTNEESTVRGPYTVQDNRDQHFVRVGGQSQLRHSGNSDLVAFLQQINEKEAKRDYSVASANRMTTSYEPIQRRMLHYPPPAPPSRHVSPVRTPVSQYAHPELGVQPARVPERDNDKDFANYELKPNRGHYETTANAIDDYYKKDVLNYPYGSYYLKPKPEQPFWMRLTESIRDNVQSGYERMQQFTRPVFEPLVEATNKISYNLGLTHDSPPTAQKKIGVLPVTSSVLLPAIGLVAGGAALGLGAAAVGRYLEPTEMRALTTPDEFLIYVPEPEKSEEFRSRRIARSLAEEDEENLGIQKIEQEKPPTLLNKWTSGDCSKKVFCNMMLQQNTDDVTLMEKRINTLMAIFPFHRLHPNPVIKTAVSAHLSDVIDAVRNKECWKFTC